MGSRKVQVELPSCLWGMGKMGFCEELEANANRNRDDLHDMEISDFDVQKHYGIGHRSLDEIKRGAEGSCMLCFRSFGISENRIVPPKRMQDRDYFVRRGILPARYVCMNCFNRSRNASVPRVTRAFKFKRRQRNAQVASMYST